MSFSFCSVCFLASSPASFFVGFEIMYYIIFSLINKHHFNVSAGDIKVGGYSNTTYASISFHSTLLTSELQLSEKAEVLLSVLVPEVTDGVSCLK